MDFDELERCCALAEDGLEGKGGTCYHELTEITLRRTKWQYVIHGETVPFRVGIVHWMCDQGKYQKARKYACCGHGDVGYMEESGSGVRVRPMCCGSRLCPRCSRRYGRRILRKVNGRLSTAAHGAIDHIVLTQKVIDGEPLGTTRERYERKWKRVYKAFRLAGMRNMLVTYHVKRTREVGWHYHAHCLVEWGSDVVSEDACVCVDRAWRDVVAANGEPTHPVFYRHVTPAGDAITALANDGQGEFWQEASDPVTQVLQYCVRDVVQGVENWVEGVETDDLTTEFAETVANAKLHRLYGEWRKADVETKEDEEAEENPAATEDEKAAAVARQGGLVGWLRLGSMDSIIGQANEGITAMREFVHSLGCKYFNRSTVSRRLRDVLH